MYPSLSDFTPLDPDIAVQHWRSEIRTEILSKTNVKDPGLIINLEERSLNLMKPHDWVLPDPHNESLALVGTVLLRHPDSSETLQIF